MNILKDSFKVSLGILLERTFNKRYSYLQYKSVNVISYGFCYRLNNINLCNINYIDIPLYFSEIKDLTNPVPTVDKNSLIFLINKYRPNINYETNNLYFPYNDEGWKARIKICNSVIKDLKEIK